MQQYTLRMIQWHKRLYCNY